MGLISRVSSRTYRLYRDPYKTNKSSTVMPEETKTYGEMPKRYELEPNSGVFFMVGSEVGAHLRLFRGLLYKKYPGLWRMLCSPEQRRYLIQCADDQKRRSELMNISNVTIVRATDTSAACQNGSK